MLGMGWIEIFVVVIVALFVIGPENLPEVARTAARSLRQLQRIVAEIRATVNLDELERQPPRNSSVPMPDPPVLPRVTGLGEEGSNSQNTSMPPKANGPGDGRFESQKTPNLTKVADLMGDEYESQEKSSPPKVASLENGELETRPVSKPPIIKPDASSQP